MIQINQSVSNSANTDTNPKFGTSAVGYSIGLIDKTHSVETRGGLFQFISSSIELEQSRGGFFLSHENDNNYT